MTTSLWSRERRQAMVRSERARNIILPYCEVAAKRGTPEEPPACAQGHDTREIGTAARRLTVASPKHQRFHQAALQYVPSNLQLCNKARRES